jgi:DnaJ-class molecular chaperone
MIPSDDHYATLGVARDADFIAIRAAYRALAKRYHPDATKEPKEAAEAHFRKIHEAYETLSDAQRRAAYNFYLDQRATAPLLTAILNEAPPSRGSHTSREQEFRNGHQRKPRRNRRRLTAAVGKAIHYAADAIILILIVGFLLLGAISVVVLLLIEIVMDLAGG